MESAISFLGAFFSILFSLLILAIVGSGWGYWARRWIGCDPETPIGILELWLGFIVLNLAGNLLHLIFPINWITTATLGAIGLVGIWYVPRNLFQNYQLNTLLKHLKNPALVLTGLLLFGLCCMQALSGSINYDAGMYYISSIRWLNEYPIVPGLANLFPQFGFNHSYFTFVALLNAAPHANTHFALGGIALLCLTVLTLASSGITNLRFGWLLIGIMMMALGKSTQLLASPAPDMIVGFIEIALFTNLVALVGHTFINQNLRIVIILLLSIQVVTIKLSAAIYALACIGVVLPFYFKQFKDHQGVSIRLALLGGGIFILHIIRGYLTSGYPLFPSTALGIHSLDWIATTEGAKQSAKIIYDYARNEGLPPSQWQSDWKWLPFWWEQQLINHGLWISICFASIGLHGVLLTLRRPLIDRHLLWLYMPLVGAIVFWFFTAPAWRFLGVIPFLLIALSSWLSLRILFSENNNAAHNEGVKTTVIGIISILLFIFSLQPKDLYLTSWKPFPSLIIDQMPDYPVSEVIIENKLTRSGLNIVFVPWFQCWNAPLPCSPDYNPNLHLRSYSQEKSALGSGFSVNNTGQELRPKYQTTLENGIQFNKAGYPNFLTNVSGIGAVEPWGRWTNGSEAKFIFLYPLPQKFQLKIRLLAFGPNANQETQIKVCQQSKTIVPTNLMQTFTLEFALNKPCSTLEIKIPQAISPNEINSTDPDIRKLGLGIEALSLKD